jgi:hypothetical protein
VRRRQDIGTWLVRWGFASLVAVAITIGGLIAWRVTVPSPVPNFALKSAAIYRIEIGAAAFLGLYLIALAFVLALNNRGFSEIGTSGLKAQDIANRAQQRGIAEQKKALERINTMVGDLEEFTEESIDNLNEKISALETDDRTETRNPDANR